jgi:hypothetical protein
VFVVTATAAIVAALAGPVGANADPVEVGAAARLEASATVDTQGAYATAGRSVRTARRLLASSRRRLERAFGMTIRTAGTVTTETRQSAVAAATRFSTAVNADAATLQRLARRARGRLRQDVATALRRDVEINAQVALTLAARAGSLDESGRGDVVVAIGTIGSSEVGLATSLIARASDPSIGDSTRRSLRDAGALSMRLSADIVSRVQALYASSSATMRTTVAGVVTQLADGVRQLPGTVSSTGQGELVVSLPEGSSTLGQVAIDAAGQAQVSAQSVTGSGGGEVHASGGTSTGGSVSASGSGSASGQAGTSSASASGQGQGHGALGLPLL